MIKILDSKKNNFSSSLNNLLLKRKNKIKFNSSIVINIIRDIKKNGDKALIKYEKKFGKRSIIFSRPKEIQKQIKNLDKKVKKSIDLAYSRIFKFHSKQKVKNIFYKNKLQNKLGYKWMPIDSVGIYVPGGTASYPSTVLMNAIPAIVAGTKKIVMVNPRNKGKHNPGVLYAAKKCGIKEIYSIGGAQAVAALALKTKKIKKVNKIVGPGNLYVTTAKKEVFGDTGIDMIAGPSEITVVGDKHSNPNWIASDLIAQAEHDELSQSILISKDKNLIKKVKKLLFDQLKKLPRKSIAEKSLKSNGILISVSSDQKLIEVINTIAPEHLELNIKNYKNVVNRITNAGSVFLGKYSTEAVGDYLAGTNHVLPTAGSAKFSSGLSVYDFYKRISHINLSKKGIETLGPSVITL
ncbi:MAG: histidinol dehydrogenase, partial [Pelagibacterales bacterium]|nr:histidinol dehydrogenase [Pelagibacterales bacterium]